MLDKIPNEAKILIVEWFDPHLLDSNGSGMDRLYCEIRPLALVIVALHLVPTAIAS